MIKKSRFQWVRLTVLVFLLVLTFGYMGVHAEDSATQLIVRITAPDGSDKAGNLWTDGSILVYKEEMKASNIVLNGLREDDFGQIDITGLSDGRYIVVAWPENGLKYGMSKPYNFEIKGGSGNISSLAIPLTEPQVTIACQLPLGSSDHFEGQYSIFGYDVNAESWHNYNYVQVDGTVRLGGLDDGRFWLYLWNGSAERGDVTHPISVHILGGKAEVDHYRVTVADNQKLSAVLKLTKTTTGGIPVLNWAMNQPDSRITGYRIYRSDMNYQQFRDYTIYSGDRMNKYFNTMDDLIADVPSSELSYTDNTAISGGNYQYVCTALYDDGTELPSNVALSEIILTVASPVMTINGVSKEVDPGLPTAPVIVGGRVLLPVRALIEAMGGSVTWNGQDQALTIRYHSRTSQFKINSNWATVDGERLYMDVPPQIIKGRTFLPLRALIENLGALLLWDGQTRTVKISY